eukprot:1234226-Prymnesium_polylepis.1
MRIQKLLVRTVRALATVVSAQACFQYRPDRFGRLGRWRARVEPGRFRIDCRFPEGLKVLSER